jgi:hypothetical protein
MCFGHGTEHLAFRILIFSILGMLFSFCRELKSGSAALLLEDKSEMLQ